MSAPPEGTILYRKGKDLRGTYSAQRGVVRVVTDSGVPVEVPWVEGEWDLTRDRHLTDMQIAEVKWASLVAYRRAMGRLTPEWSMLRDQQRIEFANHGDLMSATELTLVTAIGHALNPPSLADEDTQA